MTDTTIDPETAHRRPFHYEANTKDGKEYLVIQRDDDGDACFVITRMSESGHGTQMPIRIPLSQFEDIIRALCAIDGRSDPFAEIEDLRAKCELYRQAAAASQVSEDILQANINALAAEGDA